MGKLKALEVKNLKAPGRYSDGTAGLMLFVQKSGSKSWVQRVMVDGQRKDIGLGAYPAVSLAQARNLALDNKERVRKGKAVQTARQTAVRGKASPKAKDNGPTFAEIAERHIALNNEQWSESHRSLVDSMMRNHIRPAFGDKPIKSISRQDVIAVLEPLRLEKPAMSQKVRALLSGVLGHAVIKGLIQENHAGRIIDPLMAGAGKVKRNQRALPYERVGDLLAIIDDSAATETIKLGFRFMVLTAARTKEVRLAEWSEIDWDNRVWNIPGEKMKSGRPHRQPLSGAAMAVLEAAKELSGGNGYIFQGRNRGNCPMTKTAYRSWMQKLECGASPHGFRANFRTFAMEETDASKEVAEGCLAHAYGDAMVTAYARGDLLEKRRELLEQWADFVTAYQV